MKNREIKFRAWTGEEMTKNLYWNDLDVNSQIDVLVENGWKIMQYTGRKDKSKKEIYEGDFVMHTTGLIGLIGRWGASLDWFTIGSQETMDSPMSEEARAQWGTEWNKRIALPFKVVGNKFENPDFVKITNQK